MITPNSFRIVCGGAANPSGSNKPLPKSNPGKNRHTMIASLILYNFTFQCMLIIKFKLLRVFNIKKYVYPLSSIKLQGEREAATISTKSR